jgi:hypothetical protein
MFGRSPFGGGLGFGDWVFGILMGILGLAIFGLIGLLVMSFVEFDRDISGVPFATSPASVSSTQFHSSYTSVIISGKSVIPVNHPSYWTVCFRVDHESTEGCSTFGSAGDVRVGARATVTYQVGRNSGRIYIDTVAFD